MTYEKWKRIYDDLKFWLTYVMGVLIGLLIGSSVIE